MKTKSSKIFFTMTIIYLLIHVTSKAASSSLCSGSVAECSSVVETEEMMVIMESWSSQRLMEDYPEEISYAAMRRNQPACKGGNRGDSYSEPCLPQSSNHYKPGCSKRYGCGRDA